MAQETKKSLIDEVLNDAKQVRETALANAKLALEETFEPRIKSMVSRHLQNEMEEDDMEETYDDKDEAYEEEVDENEGVGYTDPTNADDATIGEEEDVDEELESSDIGKSDNADPSDDASDSSDIGEGEDHDVEEAKHDDDMEEAKHDDDMEEDLDLEAVIAELEAELDTEDDVSDEEEDAIEKAVHHHEKEFHADDLEDEEDLDIDLGDDEDEEIDLEELLSALREAEEDEDAGEITEDSELAQENARLASELDEHREALEILRGKLNEVNLLNAKLLYTTKLFRKYNLTNSQKMRVVESFDRTKTVRETKLVYSTIAESLSINSTKATASITEGFASKPTTSTKPKAAQQEVIKESNEMSDRFKRLINYNK